MNKDMISYRLLDPIEEINVIVAAKLLHINLSSAGYRRFKCSLADALNHKIIQASINTNEAHIYYNR